MSAAESQRPGPLTGVRVVELASEHGAFAGKQLADLGADVILVEPPGGHPSRWFEPFLDDEPGLERGLFWWHYNTSKRGVTLDLASEPEVFRSLVRGADVVLEGEPPSALATLGIDHDTLRVECPGLVWVSITPFGRTNSRAAEQATDLTVLAGGGPVWSCGYDDHSLAPVRGGGNQGYQTACLWAVMGTLTALVYRDVSGLGQHVDVSMHAAANVTTEAGSYEWLVAKKTVKRQTGRHASAWPTMPVMLRSADGREVTTGFPPRSPKEFATLLDWLELIGATEEFPELAFLQMGTEGDGINFSDLGVDPVVTEIFGAGRAALSFIASRLSGYEFFTGAQQRGLACGLVYSPEDVMNDPHFIDRGFPVELYHSELDRTVTYPGAPFISAISPWRLSRPAPQLGEHDEEILGPLRA